MDILFLLIVALGSIVVGFIVGYMVCAKRIPQSLAALSDVELRSLAAKVQAERTRS